MGNTQVESVTVLPKQPDLGPDGKPKCKACCACPETKKLRDTCVIENGEENCQDLIEKHKQCMRDMGFKI